MFVTLSKAGIGATIVTVLEFIFPLLGIDVPTGSIAGVVEATATVVGFVLLVWGQLDRTDLKFGLFRK